MKIFDQKALGFGTDKASDWHGYMQVYEHHLERYIGKSLHLVELGVGGVTYAGKRGASIKMWSSIFPGASISGVDIDPVCKQIRGGNIEIYIGSQNDPEVMNKIIEKSGAPNVVIDDASHINSITIESFMMYFGALALGGVYFVEDVHCSYERKFGNSRKQFDSFIVMLMRAVDIGGRKVTPHNMQNFEVIECKESLSYLERWVESFEYNRGLLVVKKRMM